VEPQPIAVPRIRVVDDDAAVRASVERLLRASGFRITTFASAEAFLTEDGHGDPGCVVLDLALPGESGLELQRVLGRQDPPMPIVFLTGHGDVHSSVVAMKAGAVDFLTKPFEASALIAAVQSALDKDCALRAARAEHDLLSRRFASLTPRERQVFARLVEGKLNKQIAAELGAAEKTVKVHRARVLQKMAVRSIAVLARMAERAGLRMEAK
jgi:FixJ family two-component response regulator